MLFTKWHPIHFSFFSRFAQDILAKKPVVIKGGFREKHSLLRSAGVFLVFLCVLFWILSLETDDPYPDARTLQKDGYVVIRDATKAFALAQLSPDYVFLKYRYVIRGCSLSTFHRDVTSSPYIYKTRHPVYTYIEYTNKESAPLLSVCPGSHRTAPFLYSSPVVLYGKGKTGVLFHCDLVHAGEAQDESTRYVEQYKIAHKDDIPILSHLQNIHTEKNAQCDISRPYGYIRRRISWIFAHIFNHHFTAYLQNRPDTFIGKWAVALYGREFYNKWFRRRFAENWFLWYISINKYTNPYKVFIIQPNSIQSSRNE